MGTSSFLDRLRGTGPLTPARAREHGALGPIGKASGYADDARLARPYDGYRRWPSPPARHAFGRRRAGQARVRFEEVDPGFPPASGWLCQIFPNVRSDSQRPLRARRRPGDRLGRGPAGRGALRRDRRRRPDRPLPAEVGLVPQPGADARGLRRRHPHRLPVHRGQLRPLGRGGWRCEHLGAARAARRGGDDPLAEAPRRVRRLLARPGDGNSWDADARGRRSGALPDRGDRGSRPACASTRGRCILCGRCVAARPDLFAWSAGATGPGAAALTRQALVVPEAAGDRRGGRGGPGRARRADRRAAPQRARPARGRGIRRQRGVGDPGAARPRLRHPPARGLLHRQPAARRRAAGHRRRIGRHDRAAARHL